MNMNYLNDKIHYLTNLFRYSYSTRINQIQTTTAPVQIERNIYLDVVLKLLSWNDPYLTWMSFLAINLLFWLIVQLEIKLFGMIFLFILILFIYDSLCDKKFTEEPLILPEELHLIYQLFNLFISIMLGLRKESPSMFCFAVCLLFLTLSFIAKNLSGILLVYIGILALFFVPLGYSKLPGYIRENLKKTLESLCGTHGSTLKEEDLLPVPNDDLHQNDADLESCTNESVTNSLISGISSMPSFLDVDDDDNRELLEEELLPSSMKNKEINFNDFSSDSENDFREIHFQDSHFTKDNSCTSSSDESDRIKFEGNLNFTDEIGGGKKSEGGLINFLTSTSASHLPQFISNVLQHNIKEIKKENSNSSESDFEVIDNEDIKE